MSSKPMSMSTWHVIKSMIWQQGALYSLNTLMWGLVFTIPLLEGLIAKLFFDTLDKRPLELNVGSIIALVIVVAVARALSILAGMAADIPWRFRISALLRATFWRTSSSVLAHGRCRSAWAKPSAPCAMTRSWSRKPAIGRWTSALGWFFW